MPPHGIQVDGRVEVGPVPQSPNVLAQVESPPLRDIVAQMLRNSDNTVAEMLTKEIGVRRAAKGSTQGGAEAITAILSERGFTGPGMSIVDGSGLDPANRGDAEAAPDLGDDVSGNISEHISGHRSGNGGASALTRTDA